MLLAIVYTIQVRDAREAAPKRIGEVQTETPFLVDYGRSRQEMLIGFLSKNFPSLNLPEPEAPPVNSLSLKALQERNQGNSTAGQ